MHIKRKIQVYNQTAYKYNHSILFVNLLSLAYNIENRMKTKIAHLLMYISLGISIQGAPKRSVAIKNSFFISILLSSILHDRIDVH